MNLIIFNYGHYNQLTQLRANYNSSLYCSILNTIDIVNKLVMIQSCNEFVHLNVNYYPVINHIAIPLVQVLSINPIEATSG